MRQEVIDYFENARKPIGKLIDSGARRGLTADSVRVAAEEVYDEILAGRQVKPIRVAGLVFERARHAAPRIREQKSKDISEIRSGVDELRKMMLEHAAPWYVKLWRRIKCST